MRASFIRLAFLLFTILLIPMTSYTQNTQRTNFKAPNDNSFPSPGGFVIDGEFYPGLPIDVNNPPVRGFGSGSYSIMDYNPTSNGFGVGIYNGDLDTQNQFLNEQLRDIWNSMRIDINTINQVYKSNRPPVENSDLPLGYLSAPGEFEFIGRDELYTLNGAPTFEPDYISINNINEEPTTLNTKILTQKASNTDKQNQLKGFPGSCWSGTSEQLDINRFCQMNLNLFSNQFRTAKKNNSTKKLKPSYNVNKCNFDTHISFKNGKIVDDDIPPQVIDRDNDSYVVISKSNSSQKTIVPYIDIFKKTEELCNEEILESLLAPNGVKLLMKGHVNLTNQVPFHLFRTYYRENPNKIIYETPDQRSNDKSSQGNR